MGGGRGGRGGGAGLEGGEGGGGLTEAEAERGRRLEAGSIYIADLYAEGLYHGQIVPWLELAASEADALRRGEEPRGVPTRVFGQECVVWWARGVVWDCYTPHDCRPVQRSDRTTEWGRSCWRRTGAHTPLAPELTFPARSSPGATTVVTNASGVDGVGGYTFFADAPGHVWLTSEVWQPWAQDALHRAAAGPGGGEGRGGGGGKGR
jgi:hypothetical protein